MGQHLDKYLYYVLQVLVAIPYYSAAQQSKLAQHLTNTPQMLQPVTSTSTSTSVLVMSVGGAVS